MTFNIEPLKEPRGLLRAMQWLFALVAFATCCDYTVKFGVQILCKEGTIETIETTAKYPFTLDRQEVTYKTPICDSNSTTTTAIFTFPGDYSSEAQFYVLVGVLTWLYCFASLALYVFYSYLYTDEQKSYPKIDLVVAAVLAFIWLAAASAWANGFLGLKSTTQVENWIFEDKISENNPCLKNENEFVNPNVTNCVSIAHSGFGKANSSILIGFLNCFLWSCNIWFLYKETSWYRARNPDPVI